MRGGESNKQTELDLDRGTALSLARSSKLRAAVGSWRMGSPAFRVGIRIKVLLTFVYVFDYLLVLRRQGLLFHLVVPVVDGGAFGCLENRSGDTETKSALVSLVGMRHGLWIKF